MSGPRPDEPLTTDNLSPDMDWSAIELFRQLGTGVAVYRAVDEGADFVFVDLNPAAEHMDQVRREELVGRRVTKAFPGVKEFGLLEVLRAVWRTGQSRNLPAAEYRDDRIRGWRENRVYRLASGEVAAVYRDVTAEVEAEQALQASEERYHLLTESTLDGVWDWDLATNTLYLSPRWKEQIGFADHELPNAFASWSDRLHPDDSGRVMAHLERFLQRPDTLWLEEFRLRHKQGHYLWIMARGSVVMNDAGEVARLLGIHIDISTRRRAEDRYRDLIETTSDWVWETDANGRYSYVSPRCRELLGYEPEELLGRTSFDLVDPAVAADMRRKFDEYATAKSPFHLLENLIHRRDGSLVAVQTSGVPVLDDAGALLGYRGIDRDVTSRRNTETELARRVRELRCLYALHRDTQDDVSIDELCRRAITHLTPTVQFPDTAEPIIDIDGRRYAAGNPANGPPQGEITGLASDITVYGQVRGRVRVVYRDQRPFVDPDAQMLVDRVAEILGLWIERHELSENLRLYERVVSTTSDLMSFVDRRYVYRIVNDAYAAYHHTTRDAIIGKTVAQLMGEETFVDVIKPELDRCFRGEDVNYQRQFAYADGTRYMDVSYRPHRDETRRVTGAVVSARDISDLYVAQEQLRDNEQRLSLALGAAQQGIYDLNVQTGEALVSDEYALMLGYDPGRFHETNSAWLERLHPDDLHRTQARYRDYMAGRVDEYRVEFRQRMATGEWKWILSVGRVIERDSAGKPLRMLGTHTDISELKHAQDKVRQAAQVFSSTIEGVTITDLDGTIIDVNAAFSDITGYSHDEAVGQNPRILQSGRHDSAFYESMWDALLGRGSWRGEIWNRRKDGYVYPEMLTISRVLDENCRPSGYVAVFTDITASKRTEERLEYLAHHDPLTELPNRLLFNARLDQSLRRAARHGRKVAVLFIDLDRFKHINDSLGHSAGDQMLQQFAQRLTESLRADDTIARISGDEFIALIEDASSAEQLSTVVRKIMEAVSLPFRLAEHEVGVTCSIGVSLYPDDGDNAAVLIRNADAAMYRAKEDGRNTYQFYTKEMTTAAFEHVFLENALRNAIHHQQFRLDYQPQLDLASGQLVGIEALIRWHHPEQGIVPPSRFIPFAEQSGLIREVGDWVLEEACRQARVWMDQGLVFGRVAVNVSGFQIQQRGFASSIADALDRHGLTTDLLELEVTESFVMQRLESSIQQLRAIRETGVTIAIDDFGTGYSSLSYLKRLPVDRLKIDRSFVRDIPQDPDDMAIAEAVIALAHAMGLEVIGEGIETRQQAEFLRTKGCALGQGYYFAKPAPATAIKQLLGTPGQP